MNKERIRKKRADYHLANKEKLNKTSAEWRANNPERCRIQMHNRRARVAQAGGELSPDLFDKLFALQKGRCACCGERLTRAAHLDHIVPIARGGRNEDANMQLLTQKCNNQKHAKDPIEFMRGKGFLI
jgi:5-methylcytosine-specific restriction endonuclease McrA